MSENGLTAAQHKMRDAGVAEQAITVFTHYYQSLEAGATGLIPEETIEPLTQIDSLSDVEVSEEEAREALSKTVHSPDKVTPVTTEEYYAGQERIAPRPLSSALDLSKIKATGFAPADSMERLEDYLSELLA